MLGQHKVPQEIIDKRMEICNACEHNVMGVCKKCGCILRVKTQWARTSCPLKKWVPHDTNSQSS